MTFPGDRADSSVVLQFHPSELKNAGWRRGALRWPAPAAIPSDAVALTADLLTMAVAAGLTPYLAIGVALRYGNGPVAECLWRVRSAADEGLGLAEALEAEAVRSPELAPLLALLAGSERSGAPVAAGLARLAGQTRAQARRRAMTRARTVPVRLLFPLVFLVLPAFLLLTVAPVVLASLSS
jgi:pilus assembly protein TadC